MTNEHLPLRGVNFARAPVPVSMARSIDRLAVLSGGGSLPRLVAEAARRRGIAVHIIALEAEADDPFVGFPVTRINWGKLGLMIETIRVAGGGNVVVAGGVRRPDLMTFRPDWALIRSIPELLTLLSAGGDDALLTRCIRAFERRGVTVVAVHEIAPELLAGVGVLAGPPPVATDLDDIALAGRLIAMIGPYDVGQAAVVASGRVTAIEGVEGTDRMLARLGGQRDGRHGGHSHTGKDASSGVLLKMPKPGQDLRIDLPAVGPRTVSAAAAAGLKGLAIASGQTLVLEQAETFAVAERLGLFVVGISAPEFPAAAGEAATAPPAFRVLGRHAPRTQLIGDILHGAKLSAALKPFNTGRALIIARRHVLGVAADEEIAALAARAAALRQWGRFVALRRRAILVLRPLADQPFPSGAALALTSARLAGLVIASDDDVQVPADVLAAADERRAFVVAVSMRNPQPLPEAP